MNAKKRKIIFSILGSSLGIGTIATIGAVGNYYSKIWTELNFYAKDKWGNNIHLFSRKFRAGTTFEQIKNSQIIENNKTLNSLLDENQIIDFDNVKDAKNHLIKPSHSFTKNEKIYIDFKAITNETRNLELIFDLKNFDSLEEIKKSEIEKNIKSEVYSKINKILWNFPKDQLTIERHTTTQANKIKLLIKNINVFNSKQNNYLVNDGSQYKANVEKFLVFLNLPKKIELSNGSSLFAYKEINEQTFTNSLSYVWNKDKTLQINYVIEANLKLFLDGKPIYNNNILGYNDVNSLLSDYRENKFNQYFDNGNINSAKQLIYYKNNDKYFEISNDANFVDYFEKNKTQEIKLYSFVKSKEYKINIDNSIYNIKYTNNNEWLQKNNDNWVSLNSTNLTNSIVNQLKSKTFSDQFNKVNEFPNDMNNILETIEFINKKELILKRQKELQVNQIRLTYWNQKYSYDIKTLINSNLITVEQVNQIINEGKIHDSLVESIFKNELNTLNDSFREFSFNIVDKTIEVSVREYYKYKNKSDGIIEELNKKSKDEQFLHLYAKEENNTFDINRDIYNIYDFLLENKIYVLKNTTSESLITINMPHNLSFKYFKWEHNSNEQKKRIEQYNKMNNVDDINKIIWKSLGNSVKNYFSNNFNYFKSIITDLTKFEEITEGKYRLKSKPTEYIIEKDFQIGNKKIRANLKFDFITKEMSIVNIDTVIKNIKPIYNNKFIKDRTAGKETNIKTFLIDKILNNFTKWNSYTDTKKYLDELNVIRISQGELEAKLNHKEWNDISITLKDGTNDSKFKINDNGNTNFKNIGEFITYVMEKTNEKYANRFYIEGNEITNLIKQSELFDNINNFLGEINENNLNYEISIKSNHFSKDNIKNINLTIGSYDTLNKILINNNGSWNAKDENEYKKWFEKAVIKIEYDENKKYFISNNFIGNNIFNANKYDRSKFNIDKLINYDLIKKINNTIQNNSYDLTSLNDTNLNFSYNKGELNVETGDNFIINKNYVIKEINDGNLEVYKNTLKYDYNTIKERFTSALNTLITNNPDVKAIKLVSNNNYIYFIKNRTSVKGNTINFLYNVNEENKIEETLGEFVDHATPILKDYLINKIIDSSVSFTLEKNGSDNSYKLDIYEWLKEDNKLAFLLYFLNNSIDTKKQWFGVSKNIKFQTGNNSFKYLLNNGKTISEALEDFNKLFKFNINNQIVEMEKALAVAINDKPLIWMLYKIIHHIWTNFEILAAEPKSKGKGDIIKDLTTWYNEIVKEYNKYAKNNNIKELNELTLISEPE
ncbi:hypothetical protein NPA07_04390 [Mycoplasmopsis caviae]|uniref:Uncharacterized protein n=1 Tax=Mycoplasmopsis caviae TaxID=55603 RepID=A0A3P8MER0_9BACT|nr:hypothetical protein [Mycoplasmopsis caviae]UUD35017.1 hypothetical protein NPA07_04390 [Mycoplasmopsis caviae]VDR42156.1 Uncharacterised protein [Mycoplasmopsis caviae]